MDRLTWEGGLPKDFHPIPADGWGKGCEHVFGKLDYTEGVAGRAYICKHCRGTLLFKRRSADSRYES